MGPWISSKVTKSPILWDIKYKNGQMPSIYIGDSIYHTTPLEPASLKNALKTDSNSFQGWTTYLFDCLQTLNEGPRVGQESPTNLLTESRAALIHLQLSTKGPLLHPGL